MPQGIFPHGFIFIFCFIHRAFWTYTQIHSPYYYVYSHISLLGLFFKNPNKGELPHENDL